MKMKNLEPMWKYVIYAYIIFWAMVLGIGGLASVVFRCPPAVMRYNMKQVILICLIAVFVCALIIPTSAHVSYAAGVPYSEYPAPPEPEYVVKMR